MAGQRSDECRDLITLNRSICMYVCMYVCVCVLFCVFVCVICGCVHVCVWMYVCMCVCMCVWYMCMGMVRLTAGQSDECRDLINHSK